MAGSGSALIVVDVQNDFCPGGALAVPGGDEVVPIANRLMAKFDHVILTQDWHPGDHASFAANNPGMEPFSMTEMPYGPQILWPVHCVQGTPGAAFHADLVTDRASLIVRKGFHSHIDSYSAFLENDRKTPTGLAGALRDRGINDLVLVGLATDFCVHYSATDAVMLGFGVTVLEDGCRAIDLDGSLAAARAEMAARGVTLATSDHLKAA
ncbi:bifunctional nicotinamidase/pyrazinamidase [Nisaea sp.]|uniref:bifunctional nicotinamidase/pyrazinamidase n=1 Tax=Nisaea sp. TaxID=2024842 RepID=UPI003B52E8A3